MTDIQSSDKSYTHYLELMETAKMHDKIEGISEDGDYHIQDFSEQAIQVGLEGHGFDDIRQSKLYLCAKMRLTPREAIERVDRISEQNIEEVSYRTRRQLN